MAEDQSALKPALRLHRLKGKQSPKSFARSWTGMNQNITCCSRAWVQPPAQQLNELLLPLPGPNRPRRKLGTKSEGRCVDGDVER